MRESTLKRSYLLTISAIMFVATGQPAISTTTSNPVADAGFDAIRHAGYDLCFPANAAEYEAVGKFGILRVAASSVNSEELPLRSVYLSVDGLIVPLQRITVDDAIEDAEQDARGIRYWRQNSFYLIPLNLLRKSPDLEVDFRGSRRGFGIGALSIDQHTPAFVRLDDYPVPSQPDSDALVTLLKREYPSTSPPAFMAKHRAGR